MAEAGETERVPERRILGPHGQTRVGELMVRRSLSVHGLLTCTDRMQLRTPVGGVT
jgi:hypothetical protein